MLPIEKITIPFSQSNIGIQKSWNEDVDMVSDQRCVVMDDQGMLATTMPSVPYRLSKKRLYTFRTFNSVFTTSSRFSITNLSSLISYQEDDGSIDAVGVGALQNDSQTLMIFRAGEAPELRIATCKRMTETRSVAASTSITLSYHNPFVQVFGRHSNYDDVTTQGVNRIYVYPFSVRVYIITKTLDVTFEQFAHIYQNGLIRVPVTIRDYTTRGSIEADGLEAMEFRWDFTNNDTVNAENVTYNLSFFGKV